MSVRQLSARFSILGLALAATAGAVPAQATTIGQTAPTEGAVSGCSPGSLFVQALEAAPPSFSIPSPGGVITSWSVQGGFANTGALSLKVVREGPSGYFLIKRTTDTRPIPLHVLSTFPTRVPAAAGDEIALWPSDATTGCAFAAQAGDEVHYGSSTPEPAIGDTYGPTPFAVSSASRLNVSAQLEPDADADGYGDETQDACPADPLTQGTCPIDTEAPQTMILRKPRRITHKTHVKVKFESFEANVTFECRLKGRGVRPALRRFGACASPKMYTNLRPRKYVFKVRAIDAAGNADPTPDKCKFTVVRS